MNTMISFTDRCPETGHRVSSKHCYTCQHFVATSLPGCIKCKKEESQFDDSEEAK